MARLHTLTFDVDTINVALSEWVTSTNGTPVIDTTEPIHGTGSLRLTPAGAAENIMHIFRSTQGKTWIKVHFKLKASSTTNGFSFFGVLNASNLKVGFRIRNSAGGNRLQLYNEEDGVQIGSDSGSITINEINYAELYMDTTTLSATTLEGRLNGVTVGSGIIDILANPDRFRLGPASSDATYDCMFDSVTFNDDSGSYQNTWAGDTRTFIIRPDGDGDNNQWARGGTDSGSGYGQVDENPPNGATDYIQSNTLNQISEFTLQATPAALESGDTVNWVGIGVNFAISATTGGDPDAVLRIKSAGSATVGESGSISGAGATTYVNFQTATPRNYPIMLNNVNYLQPGTSDAWTKATLDTAQIGVREGITDTHFIRVSTLWLAVDYTKASGSPVVTVSASANMTGDASFISNDNFNNAIAYTLTSGDLSSSLSAFLTISELVNLYGEISLLPTSVNVPQGFVNFSGLGILESIGDIVSLVFGDVSFSGQGNLISAAIKIINGQTIASGEVALLLNTLSYVSVNAILSGNGNLITQSNLLINSLVQLLGNVSLEINGKNIVVSTATLSGMVNLIVSSALYLQGFTQITGRGDLLSYPTLILPSSVALEGSGNLLSYSILSIPASTTLQGIAALIAQIVSEGLVNGNVSFDGNGILTSNALNLIQSHLLSYGNGDLLLYSLLNIDGVSILQGIASLIATGIIEGGVVTIDGQAILDGNSSLILSALNIVNNQLSIYNSGDISSFPYLTLSGMTSMEGLALLILSGIVVTPTNTVDGQAILAGRGDLILAALNVVNGYTLISEQSIISVQSLVNVLTNVILSGQGNIEAASYLLMSSVAALYGSGQLIPVGTIPATIIATTPLKRTLFIPAEDRVYVIDRGGNIFILPL